MKCIKWGKRYLRTVAAVSLYPRNSAFSRELKYNLLLFFFFLNVNDEIVIECVFNYKIIYNLTEDGHADMRMIKNALLLPRNLRRKKNPL